MVWTSANGPKCPVSPEDRGEWATTDYCGPGCDNCGATAENAAAWNTRPAPSDVAQPLGVRLEARPADDSHDWTEIFPAQLEWAAKQGHQVRAIEVAQTEIEPSLTADQITHCRELADATRGRWKAHAQTQRTLVDWTYLYATAGQSWPDHRTISDLLIKLAEREPTQEDADRLKAGATLKQLLALASTHCACGLTSSGRCPVCLSGPAP